jgi:hypothetical protein
MFKNYKGSSAVVGIRSYDIHGSDIPDIKTQQKKLSDFHPLSDPT